MAAKTAPRYLHVQDRVGGTVGGTPSHPAWTLEHEAEAVRLLVKISQAEEAMAQAVRHRDEAVRQMLDEGVPVTVVAAALGLTRSRVYQIRDGRR